MRRATACSATRSSSSIDRRSTPGIDATGCAALQFMHEHRQDQVVRGQHVSRASAGAKNRRGACGADGYGERPWAILRCCAPFYRRIRCPPCRCPDRCRASPAFACGAWPCWWPPAGWRRGWACSIRTGRTGTGCRVALGRLGPLVRHRCDRSRRARAHAGRRPPVADHRRCWPAWSPWCIGLGYGAIAGLRAAASSARMVRVLDVLSALPFLLIVILLLTLFGRSLGRCCWPRSAAMSGSIWRA